ncbi:MAG: FecR domain-containing protein [Bacteroidota bacterium]
MEKIIYKKVSGETLSKQEEIALSNWLDEDSKNQLIYYQLKLALKSYPKTSSEEFKEALWEDLSNSITRKSFTARITSFPLRSFLKIAASVIIVSSIVITVIMSLNRQNETDSQVKVAMIEKASLMGQKLSIALPDGSIVKLNAGSKLSFHQIFTQEERRVILEGEAFFEVAKSDIPFIVEAGSLDVRVLGTSFNIDSYRDKGETTVAVTTGLVSVEAHDNVDLNQELSPGQMLTYQNDMSSSFVMSAFDTEEILGWKDNLLVFNKKDLHQIIKELNRWYNVSFILDENVEYLVEFSGKYKNPSLDDVMLSLSYAYNFKYEINNKQVNITK